MEIKEIANKFLNGEGNLQTLSSKYHVPYVEISAYLKSLGYIIKTGYKLLTIIGLKEGVDEYIKNIDNPPSLSVLAKKYHMCPRTLSNRIKELGYEVINYQNKTKFNEHIFDSIDTEEKAYWLGFIFADGYIDSSPLDENKKSRYTFELSLKADDINHLHKFNQFMEHSKDNVKIGNVKCNGKICKRCRWGIVNKHLWNTLNNLGCVPRKSLVLDFPKENLFKDKSLIRHFIRGYFDGDGCISYSNKDHTKMQILILSTKLFLDGVQENIPENTWYNYKDISNKNTYTKVLQINGKPGLLILYYLYNNATIYLDRKYDRYKEYCRLYSEEYKLLESRFGKILK